MISVRHDNEESLNASRNSIPDTLNDCLSMQIVCIFLILNASFEIRETTITVDQRNKSIGIGPIGGDLPNEQGQILIQRFRITPH